MGRNPLSVSSNEIPFTPEELNIKSLWIALSVAEKQKEKRGLEFGRACYEFRQTYSAQGQKSTSAKLAEVIGWQNRIEELGVSLSSAKNWIIKWEEHLGKAPKPPDIPEILEPEPPIVKPNINEVVTPEERNRQQLVYLVKRITSLQKALQGLNDPRSTKYAEYADIVHASVVLKGTLDTL